ncbi:hypothetical protein [Ferruginibacter sp.]
MSDNQRFDEHIKDQFRDYSPDVHPRIWDNIMKEREKRRPAGFWYNILNGRNILIAAALLLAGGSGAFFLSQKHEAGDEKIATINGNSNQQNGQQNAAATDGNNNNNTGTDKNDTNPVAGAANNNKEATTNTSTSQQQASIPTQQGNDNTNSGILTNDNNGNDGNVNTKNSSRLDNRGKNKFNIYSPFATADNEGNGNSNSKTKKSKLTGVEDGYDMTDAAITYDDPAAKDYYLKRLLFAGMQRIEISKGPASSLQKRNVPNVNLPGCPTIEKNAAGNKTYIEVYAGPDMAFRNFTDTGNSAYLQKRKESTKITSAYSAGIRYTKVFSNGVSLRTGINYSQVNEKFTYVQGNLVQITYIINANGDTTGSYITTGTRYKTTYNKYRTIDVPLLIGYEMGNGKFHANINAGVIVNAYSWQKGEVLDTAFKPVSITTGKGNSPYQYKTNIGVGFMVGSSFYYKLNDKLHILAEPYFRYSLQSMSNEKLTFKQKNNTAGIRIGLRLDLGKE